MLSHAYSEMECMYGDGTPTWLMKTNISMTEEIQVWRIPPSLRGSVGDLQLQAVILHKNVQEDPSTPLQKPREEVEDPRREVGPTGKIIIKLKTQK
jgi:hypothetical protein